MNKENYLKTLSEIKFTAYDVDIDNIKIAGMKNSDIVQLNKILYELRLDIVKLYAIDTHAKQNLIAHADNEQYIATMTVNELENEFNTVAANVLHNYCVAELLETL